MSIYKLPIAKGNTTKMLPFALNSSDPAKILKGFSFATGDTVYACRDGVVCMKTEVVYREGYRTGENALTVLQPENSFAKYEVFADSQLFVNIGD